MPKSKKEKDEDIEDEALFVEEADSELEIEEEEPKDELIDEPLDEEIVDPALSIEESIEEVIEKEKAKSSWTYYALIVVALMLMVDVLVRFAGHELFWSDKVIYFSSMTIRAVMLLVITFIVYKKLLVEKTTLFVVTGLIGIVSGLLLSISRFVMDSSFWTFLNLIVEPIDHMLIGFASAYIVYYLTKHTSSLIKKNI